MTFSRDRVALISTKLHALQALAQINSQPHSQAETLHKLELPQQLQLLPQPWQQLLSLAARL